LIRHYVNPYVSTVGNLLSSLNVVRKVFTNLNKLDPNATQKDKAVNISKSIAAVTSLIPNPVIAPIATGVVETASYLTDFQEERTHHPSQQILTIEQTQLDLV
jgi:hypothetical protein